MSIFASSPSKLIGLYGGSFDPVHHGHVATARELLARLPFQEIRFLPAARSPLKEAGASSADRLAMLRLALTGEPRLKRYETGSASVLLSRESMGESFLNSGEDSFWKNSPMDSLTVLRNFPKEEDSPTDSREKTTSHRAFLSIDERELHRPPPSYAIDTLREIRQELGPDTPLAFILGMDALLELPRWKDWQALTTQAHLVVASRPGHAPAFAPELSVWLGKRRTDRPERLASPIPAHGEGAVLLIETAPYDIASRDIRAALRAGADTSRWLAPAVRGYIDVHHLYRGDANPQ